jgi:hypothetical protein
MARSAGSFSFRRIAIAGTPISTCAALAALRRIVCVSFWREKPKARGPLRSFSCFLWDCARLAFCVRAGIDWLVGRLNWGSFACCVREYHGVAGPPGPGLAGAKTKVCDFFFDSDTTIVDLNFDTSLF